MDIVHCCYAMIFDKTMTKQWVFLLQNRFVCIQWVQNLPRPWQDHGQGWRQGNVNNFNWSSAYTNEMQLFLDFHLPGQEVRALLPDEAQSP